MIIVTGAASGIGAAAGVTHQARLGELASEDFERVMAINALGPVLGMRAVTPLMPPGGSIVNICWLDSGTAAPGGAKLLSDALRA